MFNLPWYAWFNVLAIPLVWLLVWTGLKIEQAPGWQYKLSVVGHLSLVAVIALHWNQHLAMLFNPADYLLASLALATSLYLGLSMLFECLKTTSRTIGLVRSRSNVNSGSKQVPATSAGVTRKQRHYVNNVMDIEDDECADTDSRQLVEAISSAFSPNESVLQSELVQRSAQEFSDEELCEDPYTMNVGLWMITGAVIAIVSAPAWMSWNILNSIPFPN